MRRVVASAIFLIFVGGATATLGDEAAARRTLEKRGLIERGKFWICPEEAKLHEQLRLLPRQERAFFPARDKFQELVKKYETYRTQLEQARAQFKQVTSRMQESTTTSAARQQLEIESRRYSDQVQKLEREINKQLNVLDEQSPMTEAAIELVNCRNTLGLSVLAIIRQIKATQDRYDALADEDEISQAVETLAVQLGPMSGYDVERRHCDKIAGIVFGDGVPIYCRSGQYRVSLIVADQTAATFSFMGAAGPTVIPASLLQSAGMTVNENAAQTQIVIDDREITGPRVRIPRLRIGKTIIEDVDAIVLPPEHEDLGGRISMEGFGSYRPTLDTQHLWLRLR